MVALVLAASLALVVVFAAAGVGKLLDLDGSGEAARGFGVPGPLAGPIGVALPLTELAIAVLLLPAATRLVAALAGLGLLLAFCVAIGVALARGKALECHCFGRLHSEPVSRRTLARNAALAALAVFVAVGTVRDPAPGAFAWLADLTGTQLVVLVLAVVLAATITGAAYAILHLLQAHGRVLDRLDRLEGRLIAAGFDLDEPADVPEIGLEPGSAAPAVELATLDGHSLGLADLLASDVPTLLVFTSPTCGPCSALMPEVVRWQDELAGELAVAILSSGVADVVRADAAEHGLERVVLDPEHAALEAFRANGTPSAVLVGPDGTIASWVAQGSDWIERLVETRQHGLHEEARGLPIGAPAPEIQLPDLGGSTISLASLRGAGSVGSVLLFWNPGCGYCRALHEDVLDWERHRSSGSPRLVVVSSGSVQESAAEGFASTVLLDGDFTAGGAFGVGGTPMAVGIDADGRVASYLATGRDAVLALLGATAVAPSGRTHR